MLPTDMEINRVLANRSFRLANDTVLLANDTVVEEGERLSSCVCQYASSADVLEDDSTTTHCGGWIVYAF